MTAEQDRAAHRRRGAFPTLDVKIGKPIFTSPAWNAGKAAARTHREDGTCKMGVSVV